MLPYITLGVFGYESSSESVTQIWKSVQNSKVTVRLLYTGGGGAFKSVQKSQYQYQCTRGTLADDALYYSTIYPTLVTWVPQNRQGTLDPSLRKCSVPPPFKWGRQLLWLGYHRIGRESSTVHSGGAPFSIVNPRGRQLKAHLYSSELSYSYCMGHQLQ